MRGATVRRKEVCILSVVVRGRVFCVPEPIRKMAASDLLFPPLYGYAELPRRSISAHKSFQQGTRFFSGLPLSVRGRLYAAVFTRPPM